MATRPRPTPSTSCVHATPPSRGSALDYLLATWHPAHRPATLDFEPGAKWLGLQVHSHRVTGADTAEVEFVARHRVGGRAVRLHERSRFVREPVDGVARWLYLDGDLLG
jgi:SEC-C motif-containing protein